MARAAGHAVEQHETAVRTGVGAHHERTEFPAVETQQLSPRETKRMGERRGHGEIGVAELRDVDDGDVVTCRAVSICRLRSCLPLYFRQSIHERPRSALNE